MRSPSGRLQPQEMARKKSLWGTRKSLFQFGGQKKHCCASGERQGAWQWERREFLTDVFKGMRCDVRTISVVRLCNYNCGLIVPPNCCICNLGTIILRKKRVKS